MKKLEFPLGVQLYLVLACLLSTAISFAQNTETITYSTPGNHSFQVPSGTTSVVIEAWGAGGAGGRASDNHSSGAAGGGSGAYVRRNYNNLSAGDTFSLYIGQGGNGDYNSNNRNGGTTTVTYNGFQMSAGGGTAGGNSDYSGNVGQGGQPSNGEQNNNGTQGNPGNTSYSGSGGNAPNGGNGGNGVSSGDGNNGQAPGGGGAGGKRQPYFFWWFDADGGNGGNGRVKITYISGPANYCTPTTANNQDILYIDDVEFVGTLNDVANLNSGSSSSPKGYQDFSSSIEKPSQVQGGGININVTSSGNYNNGMGRWKAWIDWNQDGDFDDNGETIYNPGALYSFSMSFGFIIPENATPGDYRIRIRNYVSYNSSNNISVSKNYSACETFSTNGSYYEYGEAEDYTFTVIEKCDTNITSITNGEQCGAGSVTLSVNGSAGTTSYKWYTTATGGSPIATTTTGTWDTPEISETTYYYVTASNGSCESAERSRVTARINPVPDLSLDPENPVVCGEDAVIELSASGDLEQVVFFIEDFENGGLGVFNNVNSDSNSSSYDNATQWMNKTSTFLPTNTNAWFPAIASGISGDRFALATSDVNPRAPGNITNSLTLTNSINTNNLQNLSLQFEIFYSREQEDNQTDSDKPEYVAVEVFNGANWVTIQEYDEDLGQGTNFQEINLDLSDYINISNLKVRFRHHTFSTENSWWAGGVAIDNVELYGYKPLTTAYTWSGAEVNAYLDEACTIPYIEGTSAASNVYIKPTLDQLQVNLYEFTVSAVLSNGCIASRDVTVTNNTKIWQGTSINDSWLNPYNWLPFGAPTEENCVIVRDDFISDITNNQNGQAKNFKVKNGGEFTIEGGGTLTVQEGVIVEEGGIFHIQNNGSLIQVQDVENQGNITMDRDASISRYDYVYWSSPVADFDVQAVSPNSPTWSIYEWIPTVAGGHGQWATANENMIPGKGYIIRAPGNYPIDTDIDFTATFEGTPNNGTITKSISRGNYTGLDFLNIINGVWITNYDDNWNLVGNPYPSAISVSAFLTENLNIEGAVRIWTHGNNPSSENANPFYANFGYNYSSDDYIVFNATGLISGLLGFDGYIAAGQSFFVKMADGSAATENITFSNNMRSETFNNDSFFRVADLNDTPVNQEGRIWLDIISPSQTMKRTLVGYINGATNEKDRLFDAYADEDSALNLYTTIEDENVMIQGRSVPFENTDIVPLGFLVGNLGNYTIAIAETDGLFSDGTQTEIYLKDHTLNITHNLSDSPYTFFSAPGRYNDRFTIEYVDTALSLENPVSENTIKVATLSNETIRVLSTQEILKDITVYDLTGKLILSAKDVQSQDKTLTVKRTNSALLINITTNNGATITKKLIH